jgi:hypothetical protein
MTATARSVVLRAIEQGVADALPLAVEEVVLTRSVSRGVAEEISDIGQQLALVERMVDEPRADVLTRRLGYHSRTLAHRHVASPGEPPFPCADDVRPE